MLDPKRFGPLALALPSAIAAQDPVVTSVSPTSAENPGVVQIQGSGFDSASLVFFDGQAATVLTQTPTQLDVQPAPGDPGFADVQVTSSTGSTVAAEAGVLWPALSAAEGGLGGQLQLALENGVTGLAALGFSLGVLPAPVPIDPSIYFGLLLDPTLGGELGTLLLPATGSASVGLPIGVDPSLLGLEVYLQAFATQGAPAQDLAFSNAASVVVGASVPPIGLAYPINPATYDVGQRIVPNTPAVSGWVETWSVAPALPAGLVLDPNDGTLSGTPTAGAPTADYVVTAANPAGASTDTLTVTVNAPPRFELTEVVHGFGQLLPHRTLDPTTLQTTDITSLDVLIAELQSGASILPVPIFPTAAVLPDGTPGNHYFSVRFSELLDLGSVLDPALSAAVVSHLTGAITVTGLDPATGVVTPVQGQPFVDGKTYGSTPLGGAFALDTWVVADPLDLDGDGVQVEPADVGGAFPGLGYPGSESASFPGAVNTVSPDTFVFVADTDGDLTTHEAFPAGLQLRLAITSAVLADSGEALADAGVASVTVGPDDLDPVVQLVGGVPAITPGNGDVDVDPETNIRIQFTEAVDVARVGPVPGQGLKGGLPPLLGNVQLTFGDPGLSIQQRFTALPVSPFDFTLVELDPFGAFPGDGPAFFGCDDLGDVTVRVLLATIPDLVGNPLGAAAVTGFSTGEGQGLVNAPVAPDALYVGRADRGASLSVLDLNGFGASTGNPTYDITCPIGPDETNYPNNPNLSLQGALLIPPLNVGSCPLDGGSDGAFTLTVDTSLDDRLLRGAIQSVDDMALGHSLDQVYFNDPEDCLAGAQNPCAGLGFKVFQPSLGGPNTLAPGGIPLLSVIGGPNPISWAPHPNPPALFVNTSSGCAENGLYGEEPTSIDTGLINLLGPGPFPFGNPLACIPATSLLSPEQNSFFQGPSPPQADLTQCSPFAIRQQVGHFLYIVDRTAGELLVVSSNRFYVLDRIALPDPTRLAMSPNLDFLAVTNRADDSVSFVSIDPQSPTFHQVVQTTQVGDMPYGIAWESGNEDILVCNEGDGTVSVISAFTLEVRKTLSGMLTDPFEVVTTPRQLGFGLGRGVYYGWILNRSGKVSLFESGPDGVNGWGYDDVIGETPFTFANPTAIQPDPLNVEGGVWITHEQQLDLATGAPTGLGGGAVTRIGLTAVILGISPIDPTTEPNLRDLDFVLTASVGSDVLTGVPADLAFDNHRNFGSLPNFTTVFSAASALTMNGKSLVKAIPGSPNIVNVNEPQYLVLAIPSSSEGPGVLEVLDLATLARVDLNPFAAGTQSLGAPGASVLMDYFRQ
ncbi:MAG: putative Ig domain-containing protein [Planctomycetota bacterium]